MCYIISDIMRWSSDLGSDAGSDVGSVLRFRYTFELYLTSEKLYQFGLETADTLHSWTKSIGKVGNTPELGPK